MALEIQGKLIKLLTPVTGEGRNGAWTKQEFVVETAEQYPKKICISIWTEKIPQLLRYQIGDDIRVSFNAESKEYNERWFTELRAWKIDPATIGAAAPGSYAPPAGAPPSYSRPANAPADPAGNFQTTSAPAESFLGGDQDDLPF